MPEKEIFTNVLLSNGWYLLILSFIISAFVLVNFFFNSIIIKTLGAAISYKISKELLNQFQYRVVQIVLNGIFILALSYFILEIIIFQYGAQFKFYNISIFFVILVLVLLFFLLTTLPTLFIGILFKNSKLAYAYIKNGLIYYIVIGFFLLPVITCIPFFNNKMINVFIILGLLIIFFGLVFRYLRGISILREQNISSFHIFLYLCTLEILPLIYVAKVVAILL